MYFQLVAVLPSEKARHLGALLEAEESLTYAYYEDGATWRVEVLHDGPPDVAARDHFERLVFKTGGDVGAVRVEPVPEIDWLAENRRQLAPIKIGRFVIHGTLEPVTVPVGRFAVELDAGLAFGTGRHATTHLCLAAMAEFARKRRMRCVLDLGTGAGLLAIAAARLWPGADVVGVDIDPIAVRVARENVRRNRVGDRVAIVESEGIPAGAGRFDLIVANVLAPPLHRMAPSIARAAARGGIVILSGLLDGQVAAILARYRAFGFVLKTRYDRDGWAALVLNARKETAARGEPPSG